MNAKESHRLMRNAIRGSSRIAGLAVLAAAVSLTASFAGRAEAPGNGAPFRLAQAAAPTDPAAKPGAVFSSDQRKAIEAIIKDYLIANPEVMLEIQTALESRMEEIQAKKLQAAVAAQSEQIFRSPDAPIAGNPKGDITVVEFFDYNCGYCKRAFSDIAKLIDKDKSVKLVLKELPILSKGSEEGTRVALAAKAQGKYWEVHRALLESRAPANEAAALKIAEKVGLDMVRLKKDMTGPDVTSEIVKVRELAQKMGIQGTPHFLVGEKSIPGAPENLSEVLSGMIADVRKTGCAVC